jgi:putative resolvase
MKLSAWAQQQGIHYVTAYRWFRAGKMPVPTRQTATGTILVDVPVVAPVEASAKIGVALYARVSGSDQRDDLDRQMGRLALAAGARGWPIAQAVTEIGSGLSPKRPKLHRLLSDPSVTVIVVEHRDRLARFGVEALEAALSASGRSIVVLNEEEVADDLVRDMTEVLTSLCARLYGRRSAAQRARRAMKAAIASDPVA